MTASNIEKKPVLDKLLVKRAQEGEAGAFGALYEHYKGRIYSLALRIMKNEVDAEDIVQDTFMTVFDHINDFKFKSQFYTWLYKIAVNKCYERLRKNKKINAVSLDNEIETIDGEIAPEIRDDWDSGGPVMTLENKELVTVLKRIIDELPVKYRTVLTLKEMDKLKNEEIANILGISLSATKARLHRARLKIQQQLNAFYRGENILKT